MPKWTDSRLDVVPVFRNWTSGTGPMYSRLAHAMRSAIERGELPGGTRLPPERPLAEALEVSRTTVVLAYQRLRELGLVESRQGSGTWVPRRAGALPAARRLEAGHDRSFLGESLTRAAAFQHEGTIGFMGACLPAASVPLDDAWRAAEADIAELASGTGYSPQGWPALRRGIAADFERRGVPTTPDEILVTSGAQQAIDLVTRLLVPRDAAVVLEDPTYLGAIDVFALAGAQLVPVPVGTTGIALCQAIEAAAPALVYLVPTYQNPTGGVMPESDRREIARLAEEKGVAVLEDESLSELGFGAEPPPPIARYAPKASVLTIGSMSKLYWGGLRVGWVRAPRPLVERLTRVKVVSDLSGAVLSQALAARLLARRDDVVRARRQETRRRYRRLAELLREALPDWSWTEPSGGLTLWARLPTPSAYELARVAPSHGVSIVPGPVHSPSQGHADRVRLPYVLEESLLAEGVARLARAWEACRHPLPDRRLGVIV
jgi:DNA-binding transcriptional MocR family regulator